MSLDIVREFSSYIGILAAFAIFYRVVGTWNITDLLHKALGFGVIALLGLTTYASYRTFLEGLPALEDAVWVVLVSRLVALGVAVIWPKLIGKMRLRDLLGKKARA